MVRIFFTCLLLLGQHLYGKTAPIPEKVPPNKVLKITPDKNLDIGCEDAFMGDFGGNGYFSYNAPEFYVLARTHSLQKDHESNLYHLYQVNLENFKYHILETIEINDLRHFFLQGTGDIENTGVILPQKLTSCPSRAVSYTTFHLGMHVGSPTSGVTTISEKELHSAPNEMVSEKTTFTFVDGPNFPFLFHLKNQKLLQIDRDTQQVKKIPILPIAENEYPLYVDPDKRQMYTWQRGSSENEAHWLSAYDKSGKVVAKLAFAKNEKLAQQNRIFGKVLIHPEANSIELLEIGQWTGTQQTKSYPFDLPQYLHAEEVRLTVNWQKKISLITGALFRETGEWKTVVIYDFDKRGVLDTFKAKPNQFINFAGISPDGTAVALEIRESKSHLTSALAFYRLPTKKWLLIPIKQ